MPASRNALSLSLLFQSDLHGARAAPDRTASSGVTVRVLCKVGVAMVVGGIVAVIISRGGREVDVVEVYDGVLLLALSCAASPSTPPSPQGRSPE